MGQGHGVQSLFPADEGTSAALHAADEMLQFPGERIAGLQTAMIQNLQAEGLYGHGAGTVTMLGEKLMEALKRIDKVAYIRFASVYRSFDDIGSFQAELAELAK